MQTHLIHHLSHRKKKSRNFFLKEVVEEKSIRSRGRDATPISVYRGKSNHPHSPTLPSSHRSVHLSFFPTHMYVILPPLAIHLPSLHYWPTFLPPSHNVSGQKARQNPSQCKATKQTKRKVVYRAPRSHSVFCVCMCCAGREKEKKGRKQKRKIKRQESMPLKSNNNKEEKKRKQQHEREKHKSKTPCPTKHKKRSDSRLLSVPNPCSAKEKKKRFAPVLPSLHC